MRPRPLLRSKRLLLRPFAQADAPRVAALCGEKEIAATTLFIPHPYSVEDAQAWLQGHQETFDSGHGVQFAICRETELIGAVGLVIEPQHDRAELGYWIGTPYWGAGYASEAAAAVVRYGFLELKLNRVHAYHYLRNSASGRVLEKIGMKYEGLARQHIKKWGQYEDCSLYGLIRADYDSDRELNLSNASE
jgi:[ribosomal protein S5]-alanine N-acetyltransferase